ncbi:MAG TPA: diacylglycerol kinase family protein [Smithella sp.]|nr:diacylglycerol kinase family protein [Smithella sp.]HOG91703.1 diacylglycerol kinase family protein [Smithella sp.]
MKYGIIANPVSGKRSLDEKQKILNEVAGILKDATVAGLDTKSPEEFSRCANELSRKVKILLVAGGDGTFSLVMNSVSREVPLGFLPFGSGDVLRHTFNLPRCPKENARAILAAKEHLIDAICCDGKTKALFASIGIEGSILLERDKYLINDLLGFTAYGLATLKVLFDGYIHADLRVLMDGQEITTSSSLTAVITKLPYYGYGFKVVPQAQYDDGYLHLLILKSGPLGTLYALATSLMGGNRVGDYYKARDIHITTSTEQFLQRNGDPEKERRKTFSFNVLPKELKLMF